MNKRSTLDFITSKFFNIKDKKKTFNVSGGKKALGVMK